MSDTKSHVNNSDKCLLFSPLRIRDVLFKNRISVSPVRYVSRIYVLLHVRMPNYACCILQMCQYSSEDGFMTDHHFKHLGSFAVGGAGLVMAEATGVLPNGRITPACAGLWKDEHMDQMKKIVQFVHSQGLVVGACDIHAACSRTDAHIGIQLAHAGRKGSTMATYVEGHEVRRFVYDSIFLSLLTN
jgi:2,4-dienoyl-CoA reductase-like NADH-dependent reductase (Old Yellow Enzyme family)